MGASKRDSPEHSSSEGPEDDDPVPVVAAVLERNGSYLLALRPLHKRHGGLWEFPGGKVAPGESDARALARELAEELGVEVSSVGPSLFSSRDDGGSFVIRFRPAEILGEPEAREHLEVRWVSAADLSDLALAPADALFVREVLTWRVEEVGARTDPAVADVAGPSPGTYTPAMVENATDRPGGAPEGSPEESDSRARRTSPRLPRPPERAPFPGWLLVLLGGAAGGIFAGWWGLFFGAAVGTLIWRSRA